MNIQEFISKIDNGGFDTQFRLLYGESNEVILQQKNRYKKSIEKFTEHFPEHNKDDIFVYSAPGRTEIGGNHTDHQHGCVLAGAVNLDVIAVVSFHNDGVIRLKSEGYSQDNVELKNLKVQESEKGTSSAIIRGIVSRFAELGIKTGGFDAYTTSDVLSGSGLSSSAAFENLIGTIIDNHYNEGKLGAVEIAKIGQYAENVYFGKASGLMDQMVSSVGGFVFIDFLDTQNPIIESHKIDFTKFGYSLCITDTKGSHADLTDDYVSIPVEMKSVAEHFGKSYLREVDENEFYNAVPELREKCSDRAIMRSAHFFAENERAMLESKALAKGDIEEFLKIVRESGESSANLLQNLYSSKNPKEQKIPLAIMMSKRVLKNCGAVRVHGGGFAGTIQAFVPTDKVKEYSSEMEKLFGVGSCYILSIRPVGGFEMV